jgi:hypothetical protein
MAKCRGCGEESRKTSAYYDKNGVLVKEVCQECDPLHFADAFIDPTDRHLYTGPYAMPEKYKLYRINGEDVLCAKDELIQDTEDRWCNSVDDQAVELKRRYRRTEPMSRDEIQQTENYCRENILPDLIKKRLNAKYEHV